MCQMSSVITEKQTNEQDNPAFAQAAGSERKSVWAHLRHFWCDNGKDGDEGSTVVRRRLIGTFC